MISILQTQIFSFSHLLMIIFLFSFYILSTIIWPIILKKFHSIKNYSGIQRIHTGEVPRLGGLISFLGLCIFCLFNENEAVNIVFLENILLSALPLIIVSL